MTTTQITQTTGTNRTETARVPLEHPGSLLATMMNAYSRRRFGQEAEPMLALLHQRKVLTAVARFEMRLAEVVHARHGLKELASLSVASQIGCSWCMDFGYYVSRDQRHAGREAGAGARRGARATVYTPLERKVLEYAEAMTATPPTVTDEMVEALRTELDDAQLVELTEMISVENLRSRTNSALGLTSQGFKDQCDLPTSLTGRT